MQGKLSCSKLLIILCLFAITGASPASTNSPASQLDTVKSTSLQTGIKKELHRVKFQKRTVEKVYSKEVLDQPRESPWGTTTREQKMGLEFNDKEYREIDSYCKRRGIEWFASSWDIDSQLFLRRFNLKYNKVASAMLTHRELLHTIAEEKKYTFVSTGMSTYEEINRTYKALIHYGVQLAMTNCVSEYPPKYKDVNFGVITEMKQIAAAIELGLDVDYTKNLELVRRLKDLV
mgnify:CR=1 FL=1